MVHSNTALQQEFTGKVDLEAVVKPIITTLDYEHPLYQFRKHYEILTNDGLKENRAVEYAGIVVNLEHNVTHDLLTGLKNQGQVDKEIDEKLERYNRTGINFGYVMFDMTNFKHINDTYGHEMGDNALKVLAHILKTYSRSNDIACRKGGDEFVMILDEVKTQEGMITFADRIRIDYENAMKDNYGINTTVAIGLSDFPPENQSHSNIISMEYRRQLKENPSKKSEFREIIKETADRAMYLAKETNGLPKYLPLAI